MNLKGKATLLRAPGPQDAELLNRWANDGDLWHWLIGWHFPYSMASTRQWIDRPAGTDRSVWCVEGEGVGLAGTITLDGIDWKNRSAILSMMVGDPAARGTGLALDASVALLRYAFEELGLNRIEGHVLAYNERSLGLYEGKVGFRREGVRRQAVHKGGQFHDVVVLGMTAADYRQRKASNPAWA